MWKIEEKRKKAKTVECFRPVEVLSWIVYLIGGGLVLIGVVNIVLGVRSYDKPIIQSWNDVENPLTIPPLQIGVGVMILTRKRAFGVTKRSRDNRLKGKSEIKSLLQSLKEKEVMSKEEIVKPFRVKFQKKYGKREEDNCAVKSSDSANIFESPLLRAIREEKEIAFYIPPNRLKYEKYALNSLERTKRRLKRDEIPFKDPSWICIYENTDFLNGEINEKGQVVILAGPPPCGVV